jgi:putative thioredoxin
MVGGFGATGSGPSSSGEYPSSVVFDVDEADFHQRVVERSRTVPVVVDFWAEWCGPCKSLTPVLEQAAATREGQVDLAKVDVDRNQLLAQAYQVQGIPAVKAFREGQVASEFTGAVPPPEVERFFDALVPSEADRLAGAGDEPSLRRALELDPRHLGAATALGRLLLARGEAAVALEVLEPFTYDFMAAGLAARARLCAGDEEVTLRLEELQPSFEAWDAGDHERALEGLQAALVEARDDAERDLVRRVMVAIFAELGPSHELAREHRRRLAAALN